VHLRKNSLWARVVAEALTCRGFLRWTGVPKLVVAFRNADGVVAEIRGGHHVRFVWPNGGEREFTLRRPTQIDSVIDEVFDKQS
jgi:hypothetical protein